MVLATGTNVDLNEVLTWPQALVGALIVIVVMGLPQLFTYLSNRVVKKQVTNNGGSSMKDAVDRIEKKQGDHSSKLDEHLKMSQERDSKVDERLVRLETLFEFAVVKKGEVDGGNPGSSSQG